MSLLKRDFTKELERRLKEDAPLIQVINGPRQVGKTTGVRMLSGFGKAIHYATADDTFAESPDWITAHWQEAKIRSHSPLLILDEVQKVLHWSERIKALWDAEQLKASGFRLVLLGSNTLSLSRGLEESLAGRFEEIQVPHWSFQECRVQFGFDLDTYLLFGGYPASARFVRNYSRWKTYLQRSIVDTVVEKDILRLATVRKPALFRQTFDLLAAYPAQVVSYTKLLGSLQEQGNVELIKYYIDLFEGAFLFRTLSKFSGSEVRKKASSPKVIPLCPALHTYRSGRGDLADPEARGRVFEAAVGSELLKLPGELHYWRESDNYEVDYVLRVGRDLIAFEVKSGRRKGTRGLTEFVRRYPKAKPVFITPENFAELSKSPENFLQRILG